MSRTSILLTAVLVAVLVAGCGDGDPVVDRPLVVATTTIVGDIVEGVTAGEADVERLLPVGVDPHDFQPSNRQAARLREADLVVAVGLGLEEGLEDTLRAAAEDGVRVLEIGPLVDPLAFGGGAGADPHVWMDPVRMTLAAEAIVAELDAVGPGSWDARSYVEELQAVDREIAALVETLPPDRRVLVTNHDALGYFASRYGFDVIGVVIPGGSTLGEPSSAELAALVEVIRTSDVPAIFAETTEPSALAAAIAEEAGDVAVVELFTGSLGPEGSGAETLAGLLLTDARRIVDALGA